MTEKPQQGRAIFIAGATGVGKSTVADIVASRLPRAFRIDLDYFRKLMVSGLAEPTMGWTEETRLQFELAHVCAGKIAQTYTDAGIDVVMDHCSDTDIIRSFIEQCPSAHIICLRCDLDTNLHRNRERANKSFDTKDIEQFVYFLNETLPTGFEAGGFPVIDNTNQSPEQTADDIARLFGLPNRVN